MKIGIMTFWWSNDNYGQQLQCYALQKYLRDAGHDAYLIRYFDTESDRNMFSWRNILKAFNPVLLYNRILQLYRKYINADKRDIQRDFKTFRHEHIRQSPQIYYRYSELVNDPPEADMYIVGSDCVWKFGKTIATSKIFPWLLNFGHPNVHRASYAASFGDGEIAEGLEQKITPLLQKFDYVSVREISRLDFCKSCGIENTEWAPDPTMLLNADAYRVLYKDAPIRKPDAPYCFLYLVGHNSNFSVQSVYNWAQKQNINVVYVTANLRNDKYDKRYATIPEWIYLLDHAEYVITNSFHGCIFSLLFRKKFAVAPFKGSADRLDSLFELFKMEKRILVSDFRVLDEDIDWQSVADVFHSVKYRCKLIDTIENIARELVT